MLLLGNKIKIDEWDIVLNDVRDDIWDIAGGKVFGGIVAMNISDIVRTNVWDDVGVSVQIDVMSIWEKTIVSS